MYNDYYDCPVTELEKLMKYPIGYKFNHHGYEHTVHEHELSRKNDFIPGKTETTVVTRGLSPIGIPCFTSFTLCSL